MPKFKLRPFFKLLKKKELATLKFVKKDPLFITLVFATIILAVFLRTYNYPERLHFQADNSQDVQIARFAADNFKLPLAGPFSSAGPFFYGPWYFWFLEIVVLLPFGLLTPWYFMTFVDLFLIALIFYLGREVGGKWVGLFSALFAAISPVQIDSSLSVWNPSVIPLLSTGVLIFLLRFYKKRQGLDLFFLSLLVGLSITIHLQSFLITPAILAAIILARSSFKNYSKHFLLALLGLIIAFVPLIYLDWQLAWYNSKSLFIFLAVDQFNAWVPNRWLTYLFAYWPQTWANIIGGSVPLAAVLIGVIFIFSAVNLTKMKKNGNYYLLAFTFLAEVILYRYYRGQRFNYYSYFAIVPIHILSGWAIFQLLKFKKIFGVVLLILIIIFTLKATGNSLKGKSVSLEKLETIKEDIYSQYPGESFNIYGCRSNANSVSHPLALLMYHDGRDSINGIKIGVCEGSNTISWEALESLDDNKGIAWYDRSTERVYFDTSEWWKKTPPSKEGNFWQFILKNLSPGCWPHC